MYEVRTDQNIRRRKISQIDCCQKRYIGKKKRHTLKTQIAVDKRTKRVISTAFSNGKRNDLRLFKESKTHIPGIKTITDTGYQGLQKIQHGKSALPKKRRVRQIL